MKSDTRHNLGCATIPARSCISLDQVFGTVLSPIVST